MENSNEFRPKMVKCFYCSNLTFHDYLCENCGKPVCQEHELRADTDHGEHLFCLGNNCAFCGKYCSCDVKICKTCGKVACKECYDQIYLNDCSSCRNS